MASESTRPAPPDQAQRDRILGELDRCLLVEAAAGTGKTTSMVGRMVALIRSGKAQAPSLAAVTFTRKAAAELRGRFQLALEAALDEAEGEEHARLEAALQRLPQCYVGTIHSFCARLLRERPVEAGVDLAFEELDEDADARLRGEAWDEYAARLLAADEGGLLGRMDSLGLRLGDLTGTFRRFADYPDIAEWPCPDVPPLAVDTVRDRLQAQLDHMRALTPRLPESHGTDTLIPAYRRLPRIIGHLGELDTPARLVQALSLFRKGKLTQKEWIKEEQFTREEAKAEKARWDDFREQVVGPTEQAWYELRYATVIEVLRGAEQVYEGLRSERGLLNFQDLLLRAAELLRGQPHIRRYFAGRLTHLLVDEFQDTDPIQAEVMLLLTADDAHETDWRRCRPRPGSLFVVGDPKQSIYRFRRADIVTYNEVKRLIVDGGGDVVSLSANFRCSGPVVEWVNHVFEPAFPDAATPESPAYVALDVGRTDPGDGDLTGVYTLTTPAEYGNQDNIAEVEADRIARTLRLALDAGWTVSRPGLASSERDERARLQPSDVLIIAKKRARLQVYARALQAYGIPHQVTGGAALNEVRELALLHTLLRAVVFEDDPVALVGVLRSELFGVSDVELYEFKSCGGKFRYRSELPDGLDETTAAALGACFATLARHAEWLATLPPVSAIERIVADSGLMVLAASQAGGDVEAGSLGKAIEILRGQQRDAWSPSQLVEALEQIVLWEQKFDGVSARSADPPRVRIMNLHKAKGLEAPVVFLADPSGEWQHGVDLHVDRAGDRALGYLSIHGAKVGRRPAPLLAQPRGWEQHADRELAFRSAEEIRLRYVAATRGGSALIVSRREKSNKASPWAALLPSLAGAPELDDPGEVARPEGASLALEAGEVSGAIVAIEERLGATMRATDAVSGAKEYALARGGESEIAASRDESQGPISAPIPEGQYGADWGSAIHLLLELAMQAPDADLERLARTALEEFEVAAAHAPAALATVRAVMRSEIWQRAMASRRRLTEAPFLAMASDVDPAAPAEPTLLRGTVDLAFEEADGWVLVDYKTDAVRGPADLDRLVAHYAPQVQLYARAWEHCCGEPVVEAGLYFSRVDRLVTLEDPRGE